MIRDRKSSWTSVQNCALPINPLEEQEMDQYQLDKAVAATLPSVEATKLIRKLRWIGLVEEASRLQRASTAVTTSKPGILGEIPYSTD
jgi:hypothetical protein